MRLDAACAWGLSIAREDIREWQKTLFDMKNVHTTHAGPKIYYQEVEALPEQHNKLDLAFDILFEEVLKRGYMYLQSPLTTQLAAMNN